MRKEVKNVFPFLLFVSLLTPGCDQVRQIADKFGIEIKMKSSASNTGGKEDPSAPTSEAGKRAKANAELLREVYLTVFLDEPKDVVEFGGFLENLNQGGSLEGVYNGFTHSESYRQLEQAGRPMTPQTLPRFARELVYLTLEQANPTVFTSEDALPLARAVEPGVDEPGATVARGEKITVLPRDPEKLAEHYQGIFVHASFFTLKRVLADEALKVFALKSSVPDALAEWYGVWAVRTARIGVDFGLPLRNKLDEKFHAEFLKKTPLDRVRWEVLNRVHRLLNSTIPAPAPALSPAPAASQSK